MKIETDEHLFICGMTDSGKSVLMRQVFRAIPPGHAILLDVKHEHHDMGTVVHTARDVKKYLDKKQNVVFQPVQFTQDEFDQLADLVYFRYNTVLAVDEAQLVCPQGKLSMPYKRLITAGRSRKATMWAISQRPALIDKTIISQCRHYFAFELFDDHDLKAVGGNVPDAQEKIPTMAEYHYLHYHVGDKEAVVCPPVQL